MADMASAYEAELKELKEKLAAAEAEALRAQLAWQKQPEPVAEPEPKMDLEAIAARFRSLPGVEVRIKGANTSAPVIWCSGETKRNADKLKALGAKWSRKRQAFYLQVA